MIWRYLAVLVLVGLAVWAAILFAGEAPPVLDLLVAAVATATGTWYGRRYFLPSFRSAATGRRPATPAGLIPLVVFLGMAVLPAIYPSTGVLGPLALVGLCVIVAISALYTVVADVNSRRNR